MKYYKTRFDDGEQRLLFAHVQGTQVGRFDAKGRRMRPRKVSFWRFFHQDGTDEPAGVGPEYKSKAELLADAERYGTEFGFK